METPINNQPVPPIQTPIPTKKWYQHKGIIAIMILVILACAVGYWYWQVNSIGGIQKSKELSVQTVPTDWKTLSADGWQVKYPANLDYRKIGLTDHASYIFKGTTTPLRFQVISKNLNTVPEAELIKTIQNKYKLDVPEALLQMQRDGIAQSQEEKKPIILIQRIVTINEMKGAQFAYKDMSLNLPDGNITVKTSFESNGKLVDLVVFTNSIDENDPNMRAYSKLLSSFSFTN